MSVVVTILVIGCVLIGLYTFYDWNLHNVNSNNTGSSWLAFFNIKLLIVSNLLISNAAKLAEKAMF